MSFAFLLVIYCISMTCLFKNTVAGACLFGGGGGKQLNENNLLGVWGKAIWKQIRQRAEGLHGKRCSMVAYWSFSAIRLDVVTADLVQLQTASNRILHYLLPWQKLFFYIKETKYKCSLICWALPLCTQWYLCDEECCGFKLWSALRELGCIRTKYVPVHFVTTDHVLMHIETSCRPFSTGGAQRFHSEVPQ